jgi:GNAT superfamily N-acetyltransferase
MPKDFTIRPAGPQDAAEIARVNQETWVETYRGILDEASIQAHTLEEQTRLWQQQLATSSPSEKRFVAEAGGVIVGYCGGGRNPDPHSPFQSELFGIYVLKDYQKRGMGAALLRELAAWLLVRGYRSMLVWVLDQNPHRNFYSKLGGLTLDQLREIDYSGKRLSVVSYGWTDLRKLA